MGERVLQTVHGTIRLVREWLVRSKSVFGDVSERLGGVLHVSDEALEDGKDLEQASSTAEGSSDPTIDIYSAPTPIDGKGTVPEGENKTPFEVPSWSAGDIAALLVAFPLGVLCLPISLLFLLLVAPLLLLLKRWTVTLDEPTRRIGDTCGFLFVRVVSFVLATPALLLLWSWTTLVYLWILVFSTPIGLFRIVFLGRLREIRNNFALLSAFKMKHRWIWGDVVRAICGQILRQGLGELFRGKGYFLATGVGSLPFIPIFKYGFMANPFVYTLETKFANQWTPPLDPPKDHVFDSFKRLIGYVKNTPEERADIDKDVFAAHYPFPPAMTKRPVNGLQYTHDVGWLLFTKSTWCADELLRPETKVWIDKNAVLVELSYWNPFHVLVAVVPVSYRKDRAFEHPMWTIVGKGSFLSYWIYERVHDLFGRYGSKDAYEWFNRCEGT